MVDWASHNRLYPPGYSPVDIRTPSADIDSSLPYSISPNKRHSCRSKSRQLNNKKHNISLIENFQHGLNQAFHFFDQMSADKTDERNPKLLATYQLSLKWPRSVCCFATKDDNSIVVCEQEECRLLLFTSQLMLRSTCGGKRGNGPYEFDSPWSVAALFDNSSSNVIVADTNNRRVQYFTIGYNDKFIHKHTFTTKEKPYCVATSKSHFAVSCEKGLIMCFSIKEKRQTANINLNQSSLIQHKIQAALPFCMDAENSFLFISNSLSPNNVIYEMTVNGEYLRSIHLDHYPFLRISSLTFDNYNQQLVIVDSLNSVIYSVEHDLDDDNVELVLKRSDNLNYPQASSIGYEGHLIVVECSVTTQHTLKIFRYRPCMCHSRLSASSIKTSETTSIRSMIFPF